MQILKQISRQKHQGNFSPGTLKKAASARSEQQESVPLLALQRGLGTRTLQRLVINQPGDLYEREADRVAEQVMRMPVQSVGFQPIISEDKQVQRKCACEEDELRRKETGGAGEFAPPVVQQVLQSPGQPLEVNARAFFAPRFRADFSRVRVHTDAKAAESARAVNALAYTVGQDIVFGVGRYSPQTVEGKKLIAHELAHVIQQSRWGLSKQQGATVQRAVKITASYQVKDDFDPAQQVKKRQRAFGRADPILNSNSLVPGLRPARFERALNNPTLAERNLENIPRPDLSDPLLDPVRSNLIEIKSGHRQRRRVQLIQEALVAWGRGLDVPIQMLPRFGPDGIFGDETLAAVKEFQEKSPPLAVDGVVGDETLGRLDSAMNELHGSVFTVDTVPDNDFQGIIHIPPPSASWTSLLTTRDFVIDQMLQNPLDRAQLANHFAKCPPNNTVRVVFADGGNMPSRILVHERHHEADQLKTIDKHLLLWDIALVLLSLSQQPFRAPDPQTATELIFASLSLPTPCELSTDIVHEWIVDNVRFHSTLAGAPPRLTLTRLGCDALTFTLRPPNSATPLTLPQRSTCAGPVQSLVVTRQIPV